ncbi:MAG TPA: FAD-dependent oxidoreductase [Pirellulaceae bacterium]|jgi:NADPH-dependent glutamate synthase beta subunit-like oxidoreductase/NAD(P)H-flavin reductase|nr:FAD-dependent oxidoreductase [Pirellulaceae bacterium]
MQDAATTPLRFGFTFADLYRRDGLVRLDETFAARLAESSPELHSRMVLARMEPMPSGSKEESELIIAIAPYLEDFIAELFDIEPELRKLQAHHSELAPLQTVKRKFVQRRVKGRSPEEAAAIDGTAIAAELEAFLGGPLTDALYAEKVTGWMEHEAERSKQLDLAAEYAVWASTTPEGRRKHRHSAVFNVPRKIDHARLVHVVEEFRNDLVQLALAPEDRRSRVGFHLTDPGTDLAGALDQTAYCIKCHHQGKDSCSKGLREKTGEFQKTVYGVPLAGCPLGEKISEMDELKGDGNPIGALAAVTIDNPMCAGTGHRICNDCMKACIYQKQDPVDVPQIETRSLKDVLELPWGFEIYSLLTRWNPLNFARPLPVAPTGKKVLVVGLGPAGFTLAHHLMNDGHAVVAIDGLKIEPLPERISGVDPLGNRVPFEPLRDVSDIFEDLNERVMAGFGGVAEYGITVRWNKNFLKVIRLLLERREEFTMFGGIRFGGTITVDSAFDMGFDHIALCMGAGRPTVIPMKNGLARGVRQASDFLMALQLTGAAKAKSIANLQVRMPIVVIGGGLTAVDTATESLAYYPVQVEKFLRRYEELLEARGEAALATLWSGEEKEIADEFIAHAQAIRAERAAASVDGRPPRIAELLLGWGGATVAYRRRLIDAPSYTLNHEEVAKAMEEGIRFAECLTPEEVQVDQYGAAKALRLTQSAFDEATGKLVPLPEPAVLPARTILVAAGTQPNTVLAREDVRNVRIDGRYFQAIDEEGQPVTPEKTAKPKAPHVLMSRREDGRMLSFFGDLHPSFAGNVVKAMASAKQGYPIVSRALAQFEPNDVSATELAAMLNDGLRAVVHDVIRLTPDIIEIVVRAPFAARAFQPGQFYRLQNFESLAPTVQGTTLAMEGLALTGAAVDREKGLLSMIVLEMGGSSDLCALLKPGEPVSLMGPTGSPTETPGEETVLLAGGGLGNAVLFSIGQAFRGLGSKVLYFAGYKKRIDRYKVEEIEAAADVVVWCCDEAPGFAPNRPQDRAFVGNIVQAMAAYARGELGPIPIPMDEVERIIAIGSDGMMRGVQQARHTVLQPYLKPGHHAYGSINSPMQCMMKEICAQCLQTHRDPLTGVETTVFSCSNQDQPLDHVGFDSLRSRLSQNMAQERLTKLWIDHCLSTLGARKGTERAPFRDPELVDAVPAS